MLHYILPVSKLGGKGMKKTKFHLTLVILITMANCLFGLPHANALSVDNQNNGRYNGYISDISSKYNNINIKYISIKLYNININNNINSNPKKLSNALSFKEKIEILMYSMKQVESHGRYKAKSKWSDACGAYQYMPISWDNYKGFKNACLAPEWAQDSRMRSEINYLWNKYHDWQKVIASHYMPSYAGDKAKWNNHYFHGQPTLREYVQNVENTMNTVMVGLATT
jgi:hypothetical protein